MRNVFAFVTILVLTPGVVSAQRPPLLPEKEVAALAEALSGETAKRSLEGIARHHRQRGSRGFHAAAELIAERARAYGLRGVTILQFPADGTIFYGTQKSRQPWDAEAAELWELRKDGELWMPSVLRASYEAMPITLAQDSESADVTADLVDVADGTSESDYTGKDVRGKIVLAAAQPAAVQALAVDARGAAGIVSYAQNQRTAWSGEDETLVRWGHLRSFAKAKTFAFMVSQKTARPLRERLGRGEQIRLHALVRAGQHPGSYEVVTATIPGADPVLKDEEIAFSCHLDHQRPGANDNASGAATILEVARALNALIEQGTLRRPARTLRFLWPPEIEGTLALLNAKPELAKSIKAVVHMDMVGGGPETKAVFHVTRGPHSLPSFVHDVAEAFAAFANEQTATFADTGAAEYPLAAPEGGKEPLRAAFAAHSMGSDHDVYQEGSFRIPAIYLNDWPDRYIHTNRDAAANIDPTKLKRAAFIGAASGYFLAQMGTADQGRVLEQMQIAAWRRHATHMQRALELPAEEVQNLIRREVEYIAAARSSLRPFAGNPGAKADVLAPIMGLLANASPEAAASGEGLLVFTRNPEPKGPMSVFGYDYFEDHAGAAAPRLLGYRGLWGGGAAYAYEALNLVDGRRSAQQIRNALAAEHGPIPLDLVVEYLRALERIGVLRR